MRAGAAAVATLGPRPLIKFLRNVQALLLAKAGSWRFSTSSTFHRGAHVAAGQRQGLNNIIQLPFALLASFPQMAYLATAHIPIGKAVGRKAKAEQAAARQAKAPLAPISAAAHASAETAENGDNGGLSGTLPATIARGSSPAGSEGPSTDTKSNVVSASALVAAARLELLWGKSD